MSRTATQQAAVPNIEPGIPEGHAITLAEGQVARIADAYTEERDLVNRLLGRAEMASAISKLTTVGTLAQLKTIKENKLYRALAGKTGRDPEGNEIADVGTWEGVCQLLGLSRSKVDEDLINLSVFGEETLARLSATGAGYRELRKLRKLPENVRAEIIQGVEVDITDKEEVVALIDELASKHAREKAQLEHRVNELEADNEAMDQVIAGKNAKLDEQERLLHKLQHRAGEWAPRAKEVCIETTRVGANALECLDQLETLRDVILNEDFGENDREAALEAMAVVYWDALDQIIGRVAEVTAACEEVFVGYKEKARPMLQVFGANQD